MELVSTERGSSTHPPKGARLAAIHNGRLAAQEQAQNGTQAPARVEPAERVDSGPQLTTRPTQKRVADLSGTCTSLSSLWQISRTGESEYAIIEYNMFGATGASGAGQLSGNKLEAIVGVPFMFELRCYLTVADNRTMQGTCGGAAGNLSITLTR
jgi:hypothetical protein